MKTKKKRSRLALALPAAVFLANPHLSLIDPLPDAVGVILLMMAISPLRHTSVHLQAALSKLRLCLLYTVLSIPATALVIYLFVRFPSQTTLLPLASLSFAILDCITLIPSFMEIFRAIRHYDVANALFENEVLPEGKPTFSRALEMISRFTPLFFLLRAFLPFLPDLLMLTDDAAGRSLVGVYPFVALVAFLPGIVLGYIFASSLRSLFRRLLGVRAALSELVRPHLPRMESERRVSTLTVGWLFITLSSLAVIDLEFNRVDFLPDVFAPLLILAAITVWHMANVLPREYVRTPVVFATVACMPALAADLASALYFREYDLRDIYYSAEAESLYIPVLVIVAVKTVTDSLLLLSLYRPLRYMATEETGNYVENSPIRRQQEKNRKSLAAIVRVFIVTGIAGALLELADAISCLFPTAYAADRDHVQNGETVLPALGFLAVLTLAAMIVRFAYMLWANARLTEEIKAKYKLDDVED